MAVVEVIVLCPRLSDNETIGAALSSGSRTLSSCVVVEVRPSRSVAVPTSWYRPLAGGVNSARPRSSSASAAPLSVRVRVATAEKASASTVIATGCPGTAGKLGVSEIVTAGPTGNCVARRARPRSTVALPSVMLTMTR